MNKNDEDKAIQSIIEVSKNEVTFTKREKECLSHLLNGLTQKEIGKKLGLSHRTIEAYVKNMRQKVHVKSTKELLKILEPDID